MILVVTLNPALDITHHVAGADWAGTNRPFAVHARAGGKGLNVARTLRALGQPVTLTGLAGGLTGQALRDGLAGTGIVTELTPISAETRRTFAVADSVRGQTALFNEPGPAISEREYQRFFVGYERALASSAVVVLSGSLPGGLPADAYAGLIAAAARAGVRSILDADGAALAHGVAAGPALAKPNLAELEAVAGRALGVAGGSGKSSPRASTAIPAGPDLPAVETAARGLVAAGAGAVVVSLGAHGLLAVAPDGTWHARPPGAVDGNPTGAGDAVVAGLADSLARGHGWLAMLRHAVALGTATAGTQVAGEFALADYERLVTTVEVVGAAARGGRG
jgi:1-phosphofructokinase family hexose kinase